jgi:hypothetical protein
MARKPIDWQAVEVEYRAGRSTDVALSAKYGMSREALRLRVKKEGWTRSLAPAIKEATKAALAAESVVRQAKLAEVGIEVGTALGTQLAMTEKQVIESAVAENVTVVRSHKLMAAGMKALGERLLHELVDVGAQKEGIERLIDMVRTEDPQLGTRLRDFMSVHSRIHSVDKLAAAMTKIVAIERQAHGLDDATNKGGSVEDLLLALQAEGAL